VNSTHTTIERLSADAFLSSVDGLADVLTDAVAGGASLGFLAPLHQRCAADWWRAQAAAVADGSLIVWVSRNAEGINGTVGLAFSGKTNGRHRAEIVKLMVHRNARGQGLARTLLATAEHTAAQVGVTLLLLDTETGSAAERLYRAGGWTRYGTVPDYAAEPGGSLQDCSFFYKRLAADGTTAAGAPPAGRDRSPRRPRP
jgi:GNAT superfamily N-acetyltransferase